MINLGCTWIYWKAGVEPHPDPLCLAGIHPRGQMRSGPGSWPFLIVPSLTPSTFVNNTNQNLKLQTNKHNKSQLITCHCYGFVQTKATSLENEIVFSKPIKNRQIQNDKAAMTWHPDWDLMLLCPQIMFLISEMFRYLKASTTLKTAGVSLDDPEIYAQKMH